MGIDTLLWTIPKEEVRLEQDLLTLVHKTVYSSEELDSPLEGLLYLPRVVGFTTN
jgi:hypothetical protein